MTDTGFRDTFLMGEPVRPPVLVGTKTGQKPIEAYIGDSVTDICVRNFNILKKKHGKSWHEIRCMPIGGYNCAGMVWASRRATIPEPADWKRILTEDGYREIQLDDARIEDLVVYRQQSNGEIIHVGRIVKFVNQAAGAGAKQARVPVVLSKLMLNSGEVVHTINDVYLNGGVVVNACVYSERGS